MSRGGGGYPTENYNLNEINKEIECNLLNQILRPEKLAETINSNYSPILHGCMNNCNVRVKLKNLRILLDGGYSSLLIMGNMTSKLRKNDVATTWQEQAKNSQPIRKLKPKFAYQN